MGESSIAKSLESQAPPAMGRYIPLARLGDGGMADVFLAVARGPAGFNKLVVIKRLRNQDDAGHVHMFMDEARLSARLSHPNIVQTYEVGDAQGKLFMAMEYLEGQSLHALLTVLNKRSLGVTEAEAAFVAAQVAKGLHYAHELTDYDGKELGVVHRDVSPHNVFLTYRGEVKLLDFGIAKAAVNVTHTETGVLKGKLRYMAPEQVAERDVDRRADIFALGIVLWEMLGRRRLFEGDSVKVLNQIARADAPSLRSIRAEVSEELALIVGKALQRDRENRYATAEEMANDLERYLRSQDVAAAEREIGRRLKEMFGDTREAVKARINSFLAALPSDTDVPSASGITQAADLLPALLQTDTGGGSGPKVTPAKGTRSDEISIRPAARPEAQQGDTLSSAPPPKRTSAVPWVLAGVVALGAMVGVTWVVRPRAAPPPAASAPSPAVAPALARVHLDTMPSGAGVQLDGRPLGTTPADFVLEPGPRTLHLSKDGYEPETIDLDVVAGATIDRSLSLHAKAAASAPPPAPTPAPAPAARAPSPSTKRAPPPPAPAAPAASAAPKPKIKVIDDTTP